jgi:cell division septal protein FtsQ
MTGKRRRLRRTFFWGGILLVLGLIATGLVWLATSSGVFVLRGVEVIGATYAPAERVETLLRAKADKGQVRAVLGPDNILAWPSGTLSGAELEELPAAASVNIEKNYFRRTITVEVAERERLGLWCFVWEEAENCYWFDREGVLFLPGYPAEGSLTLIVKDTSREPLALGGTVLSERFLSNLLSVFDALRAADLGVREVRLENLELQEVSALTYDGPRLLFSLRFPAAGVQEALTAIRRSMPLESLEYVDFRVENKVYYR